nr:hypothetical protein [Tanacetum cinerariifolium]
MSITNSNLHKSFEAEDSTLPNHDIDEAPSNKLQRNSTDPSAVIFDSSRPGYDSVDESLVCSTPHLPLKKLDGAEPGSGPKTVKSILKSKSTFKAETLKEEELILEILNMSQKIVKHMVEMFIPHLITMTLSGSGKEKLLMPRKLNHQANPKESHLIAAKRIQT